MILANDWVVIDSSLHQIKCKRCRKGEPLPLPLELTRFVRWAEDWAKNHLRCKETAIPRNGLPKGIGWWWDLVSTWDEKVFDAWLKVQSRARLVQMLQETDPNGCWADEQAKAEMGSITSIGMAQQQFKIFWRESSPVSKEGS